jgi:predicted ribosome quality control (RQC) complex YloA/Tae2 family protein
MTTPRRKNKFSLLDLKSEVAFLQRRLGSGARVLNVYNFGRKTYLLKLSVPPSSAVSKATSSETEESWLAGDNSWQREYLLIESGIRLHTTRFARQAATASITADKALRLQEETESGVASASAQLASLDLDERDRELQLVLQRQRLVNQRRNGEQSGSSSAGELPSGFTLKLRKHLRTRRLAEITSLGIDRVVDLRFVGGSQAAAAYKANPGMTPARAQMENHLLIELHSGGNIILTDGEYRILAVLRIFRPDRTLSAVKQESMGADPGSVRPRHQLAEVGATYDISIARQLHPLSPAWFQEIMHTFWEGRKTSAVPQRELQRALLRALGWGPELIEHVLHEVGPPECSPAYDERLYVALQKAESYLFSPSSEGYILLQGSEQAAADLEVSTLSRYVDFTPRRLRQHAHLEAKAFPSFDEAVDEYFARLEELQLQQEMKSRQRQAQGTLDRMRTELASRVAGLRQQEEHCLRQAALIEANLVEVDQTLQTIRAALASGIDWREIEQMLVLERRRGNPIAQNIHSLQLATNEMTLMLSYNHWVEEVPHSYPSSRVMDDPSEQPEGDETDSSADEDAGSRREREGASFTDGRVELVKVDLGRSAFANAQHYYELRKKAAEKEAKTIEASEQALRAAEKKALKVLTGTASKNKRKNAAPLNTLKELRKPLWFEKFRYFITSENYLVIAGRDSQQNEQLVKRYLEENTGDLYMHADVHGAASLIIKGKRNRPAPPLSIQEAAVFAAACSSAWDAKIAVNAFWVYPEQVSRSAPSGMYLNQGSFVVRGQRNYVPVTTSGSGPLVMGFGFLFRLAPQSVWRHLGERAIRSQETDGSSRASTKSELPWTVDSPTDTSTLVDGPRHPLRCEQEPAPPLAGNIVRQTDTPEAAESDTNKQRAHEATLLCESSSTNVTAAGVSAATQSIVAIKQQSSQAGPETMSEAAHRCTNDSMAATGPKKTCQLVAAAPERTGAVAPLHQGESENHSDGQLPPSNASTLTAESEPGQHQSKLIVRPQHRTEPRAPVQAPRTKPVRGKRGKLKKFRGKYADQTEEERGAALELLGTTRMRSMVAESPAGENGWGLSPATTVRVDAILVPENHAKCSSAEAKKPEEERTEADTVDAQNPETSASPVMPVAEYSKRTAHEEPHFQWQKLDEMEVARVLATAGDALAHHLTPSQRASLSELDFFTGCPHPEDVLEYAIPVCAPYQTLAKYKYKAKLVPGTLKKGKALKQVMNAILNQMATEARRPASATPATDAERQVTASSRELDLISAIDEPVLIQQMLGNVRVLAPGLQERQRKQRAQRKHDMS